MSAFTHFDALGASRMVDVSGKESSLRTARASGLVRLKPSTLTMILDRKVGKGDVFEVARLAGIMGAKRTGELIPLCHPLGLDALEVHFETLDDCTIRVEAIARLEGRTGVEMEALVAVTTSCLTIYDMCKAADREMVIDSIRLEEKSGGRSGHYLRESRDEHHSPD